VREASGEIATRINIPTFGTDIQWDGLLSNGTIAQQGIYEFSVETFQNGTLLSTDPVTAYSRVREAIIENGETKLVLAGGITTAPGDVTALRSPV